MTSITNFQDSTVASVNRAVHAHCRDVREHVELSESINRLSHGTLRVCLPGEVSLDRDDSLSRRIDSCGGYSGRVAIEVDNCHSRALFPEEAGGCLANAAAAASHQRHLAIQSICHVTPFADHETLSSALMQTLVLMACLRWAAAVRFIEPVSRGVR